ncbi:hypothetical protein GUJ93_ZPchr0003g16894 [Zizania palustris]|uniref:Secreted protein n=1 Tax=Zizania palustris TaxID=103762 RepID=A0A8J5SJE7_ZIZPA|nr:hypothetical protein GUJ93_ZPchr0003g16894 [Zizania palustris]
MWLVLLLYPVTSATTACILLVAATATSRSAQVSRSVQICLFPLGAALPLPAQRCRLPLGAVLPLVSNLNHKDRAGFKVHLLLLHTVFSQRLRFRFRLSLLCNFWSALFLC